MKTKPTPKDPTKRSKMRKKINSVFSAKKKRKLRKEKIKILTTEIARKKAKLFETINAK